MHKKKSIDIPPMYVSLCEAVFDIAFGAGWYNATHEIFCENSRELFMRVLELAVEFENEFQDGKEKSNDEYVQQIYEFTRCRLFELYGKADGKKEGTE